MTYYERNLPHWHPPGKDLFLTWRLYGSLPRPKASLSSGTATPGCAGFSERGNTATPGCARTGCSSPAKSGWATSAGKEFCLLDAILDKALHGPLWLKDPRIAGCVVDTIERGATVLRHYILHAFVVMPNHVHLLIAPQMPLLRITNGIKGVSARDANRILGRHGKHFWQDESFDHWVRNAAAFDRIRRYIEQNPVSAGLARRPEDWPWSSASQ